MNMKKKILTGIAMCFALILAVIAAVGIYYFVLIETIELSIMPVPDIKEQLDVYEEMNFCKSGYIDEENTKVIIDLTRYQRKKWLKFVQEDMENMIESANDMEYMEYHVSEDVKELTLIATERVSFRDVATYGLPLLYDMELHQVLMGEKDWSIYFILKDMDTNEILYTAEYPEENIKINEYLWDKKE